MFDKQANKEHWTSWARQHGESVHATTRTRTAKTLELAALTSALADDLRHSATRARVLEVGCGNGVNCIGLAAEFPLAEFVGVDFVPEMISSARKAAAASGTGDRCTFLEGDALDLDRAIPESERFDVALTVRCLINLQNDENQLKALASIAARVQSQGLILILENSQQSYSRQNGLRTALGLPPRKPAEFNYFIDENVLFGELDSLGLTHVQTVDISSLHDTLLYALIPSVNGGTVDYGHPLVEAAAQLEADVAGHLSSPFGSFGQNRLFVLRRS